jgi:hypothetical protein
MAVVVGGKPFIIELNTQFGDAWLTNAEQVTTQNNSHLIHTFRVTPNKKPWNSNMTSLNLRLIVMQVIMVTWKLLKNRLPILRASTKMKPKLLRSCRTTLKREMECQLLRLLNTCVFKNNGKKVWTLENKRR